MPKVIFLVILLAASSCSIEKLYQKRLDYKSRGFEQIDFDDLAKLYMSKPADERELNIEGIYSVSSFIVKKGKPFLSLTEREKVLNQKENYSKVAIIRDQKNSDREFFEVPIDKEHLSSYSIRGEFLKATEGNILVYKHFEPKGKILNYTFTFDSEKSMLEGIRTEVNGSSTIIYKLTYLRLYPKRNPIEVSTK